jgi:transposase-like protein
MSKAVEQFEQMVSETVAWLLEHAARRHCLVCEATTVQVISQAPGWTRYKCAACGFQESIQQTQNEHIQKEGE